MSDQVTRIVLDTTELDRIAAQLDLKTEAVVRRAAFEIEQKAKMLAPVDTGAMRSSIYTTTAKEDGFHKAAAETLEKRITDLQPLDQPSEGDEVMARIGPAVEYAVFVETGTSRQAAQPFLIPAAEEVGRKYNSGEAWAEIVK